MQLIGRFSMRSANTSNSSMIDVLNKGSTLEYYTGAAGSTATISGGISNNIVNFTNLSGANLQNIIYVGDLFQMTTSNGDVISSTVIQVNDGNANNIVLQDNVWTSFANVATATGQSGNSQINITSLTGSYNLVNGGVYSNTQYPLKDIIRTGDTVTVANNSAHTVSSVDYINNIVYLSSNLSANANSYLSVNRTYSATAAYVQIFGTVGVQYFPEITDENGNSITTENGYLILLG
jgi:hypothetical protein